MAPRSHCVLCVSPGCLPLQGLVVGCVPGLDWIPPLLRYFGEYHSHVVPRVEEYCGLPESDVLLGGGGLHLSGELFYLLCQALVDEAECFYFVCVGLDCFCLPWWPAVCISRRIWHPCRISVAPARVPCRYHQ